MGTQFVVQIDNRPGALAQFARALAERGVNLVHCAAGGAGAIGYAIVETRDDEAARDVLRSIGLPFVEGTPITVELIDRPGALAELAERLGAAGIGIHGLLVIGRRGPNVLVAVTVDDEVAARAILELVPAPA
jgi:hypothetical protein